MTEHTKDRLDELRASHQQTDIYVTAFERWRELGHALDRAEALRDALNGLVGLVDGWMTGPLAEHGIFWDHAKNHPPSLKIARAALAKLEPRK